MANTDLDINNVGNPQRASTLRRTPVGVLLVWYLAVLAAALGIIWGVWSIGNAAANDAFTTHVLLRSVAQMIGGLAVAVVLYIGGLVIVSIFNLHKTLGVLQDAGESLVVASQTFDRSGHAPSHPESQPVAAAPLSTPPIHDDGLALLREINENTLLDEEGRGRKRQRVESEDKRRRLGLVERHMRVGQWGRADTVLTELERRYDNASDLVEARRELNRVRASAEQRDVAEAKQRIATFLERDELDRVKEVIDELLAKHPDSEPARHTASDAIRQQREVIVQTKQKRFNQIQTTVKKKQWSQALHLADDFMQEFPHSPDAQTLKKQRTTLAANAEIEQRHDYELKIKELIRNEAYGEALDLAERVITEYPKSPQAAALRDQLGRLSEKAKSRHKTLTRTGITILTGK